MVLLMSKPKIKPLIKNNPFGLKHLLDLAKKKLKNEERCWSSCVGEDKIKRELIEVRNMADTMIYTTEKMMKDVEEKNWDYWRRKKNVEEALKVAKEAKDKDDVEAIKKTSDELSKVAQVVGQKMYAAEQSKRTNSTSSWWSTTNRRKEGDEGPIEGEVVDEK